MFYWKVLTNKLKLAINNGCVLHGARGLVQQSRAIFRRAGFSPCERWLGGKFCPVGGPNLLPAALTLIELRLVGTAGAPASDPLSDRGRRCYPAHRVRAGKMQHAHHCLYKVPSIITRDSQHRNQLLMKWGIMVYNLSVEPCVCLVENPLS